MATHSSVLAWKIPRTEESGRLQSMGFQNLAAKQQHGTLEHNEKTSIYVQLFKNQFRR